MNNLKRLLKKIEDLRVMSYINNKEISVKSHYKWDYGKAIKNIISCQIHLHGDLCASNLEGADFRGADLRDAFLSSCNLEGADFRGADLRNSIFTGSNKILGADFRGADLRGSQLDGVNFRNVNVQGADLRGSDLRNSYLPNNIMEANIEDSVFGYNINEEALKGGCDKIFLEDESSKNITKYAGLYDHWKIGCQIQYNIGPKPEVYESMIMSIVASYNSYDRDFVISIIKEQISEVEELLRK